MSAQRIRKPKKVEEDLGGVGVIRMDFINNEDMATQAQQPQSGMSKSENAQKGLVQVPTATGANRCLFRLSANLAEHHAPVVRSSGL